MTALTANNSNKEQSEGVLEILDAEVYIDDAGTSRAGNQPIVTVQSIEIVADGTYHT